MTESDVAVEATAPVVLDEAFLEDLLSVTGDQGGDLLRMLADEFDVAWPEREKSLRAAVDTQDPETFAATAHVLRGAAGAVGAREVLLLAGRLEAYGRAGNLSEAEPLLAPLSIAVPQSVTALRARAAEAQLSIAASEEVSR